VGQITKEHLTELEQTIKTYAPKFEVKFKDESKLMKVIGKLSFFNKDFMTSGAITVGQKVYFPSREIYETNPEWSFRVLTHEFVHIMDWLANPFTFIIGYWFPQMLAAFSLLAFLAFINPYFLLFLTSLVFLAPIPAPIRAWAELRGYGMSLMIKSTLYGIDIKVAAESYVGRFSSPSYWFMWPFKNNVRKMLVKFAMSKDRPFVIVRGLMEKLSL